MAGRQSTKQNQTLNVFNALQLLCKSIGLQSHAAEVPFGGFIESLKTDQLEEFEHALQTLRDRVTASEWSRMSVNERNASVGLPVFDAFETTEYTIVAVHQTPAGSGILPEPTEYLFTGVDGKEKAQEAYRALRESGSCVSLRMYRRSLEVVE